MEFYNQLFNPQYVNPQYYQVIKRQIEQYNYEQNKEVANVVKAVHDLCDAMKKLDPEHQQIAFNACIAQMAKELGWQFD